MGLLSTAIDTSTCVDTDLSYYTPMKLIRSLVIIIALVGLFRPAVPAAMPIERAHAIYHFGSDRYVELADSALERARKKLIARLNDSLDYKPDMHIVETQQAFDSLLLGRLPHWGAAAALPSMGRIVIKSPDHFNLQKSLSDLIAHEYSHLALAGRTGLHRPPRWFDEGLAMWLSTEWGWGDNLAVSKAAAFGNLFDLKELERVNRFNASQAHVAYAQSYLTVRYFFDAYGDWAVGIFLDSIAAGADIDRALMAATGSDYKGFGAEVAEHITSRYNLTTLFMDTAFLWLALAIIVIIGAILRFRKKKQYYQQWEEQEKYESTDFDFGDPDNPEQTDDDEPWRR